MMQPCREFGMFVQPGHPADTESIVPCSLLLWQMLSNLSLASLASNMILGIQDTDQVELKQMCLLSVRM